jgi:hypothetical protein
MAQQTAVEWFVNEVFGKNGLIIYADKIDQAKAKEKEQIIDAFNSGLEYDYDDSETYYNKTYPNGL